MSIINSLTATNTGALPLTCYGRLTGELAEEVAVRRQIREIRLAAKEQAHFTRVATKHVARNQSQSVLAKVRNHWHRNNSHIPLPPFTEGVVTA